MARACLRGVTSERLLGGLSSTESNDALASRNLLLSVDYYYC